MVEEKYYIKAVTDLSYEKAVSAVREALAAEGFGVLTEIDVKGTLKKKLDVEFRPYVILGACNPPLAFRTLQAEEQIGLMLPCNVVVQELPEGGTAVSALNPLVAMQAVANPALEPVAEEVTERLRRVIASFR